MNKQSQVISLRSAEIVENEASNWLAKLDGGDLSAEDRLALKRWLAQDPEHARALKSLAAIWSDMDFLLNDLPEADTTKGAGIFSLLLNIKQVPIALAVVFLCAIGFVVWTVNEGAKVETSFYTTSIGMQLEEHFSDGSVAYINTDSMIETGFSGSARTVRLLRGEAMFDVAHDPARPFVVYAGDREVKAVGTKFVVRLTSENIVVTVTDGQVQLTKRLDHKTISKPEQQEEQEVILISEGEEVEVNNNISKPELKVIETDELERRLSWTSGQLVFKNERLEQVVMEISRYVPNRIVIDDPSLRDVRISGRFEIGDTEALLEAIEISFNVRASHIDDQVIQLSR